MGLRFAYGRIIIEARVRKCLPTPSNSTPASAFAGGYGTFDELFEVLTLVQTRKIKPLPIVLVGESLWRRAVDIDFLVEEGLIDAEDRELFWFAETAKEIWDGIQHWYDVCGAAHVATS
jgi:predicted Rossmann-fold nucleotide-binding protein